MATSTGLKQGLHFASLLNTDAGCYTLVKASAKPCLLWPWIAEPGVHGSQGMEGAS